ncbi:hypothetical protein SDJN03_19820, partial [Cucurbita argyrosperma subsp. sororia]
MASFPCKPTRPNIAAASWTPLTKGVFSEKLNYNRPPRSTLFCRLPPSLSLRPLRGPIEVTIDGTRIRRIHGSGIKDGRFFLGSFYCMDKQGNIILQDAVEYRSTRRSSPSPMEQRCLGLILIPNSCRVSCHVDSTIDEQLALLSV